MSDRYPLKEKFCKPYKRNDDFDYYFGDGKNEMTEFIDADRATEYYAFEAGYELRGKEKDQEFKLIRKNLEEVIGKIRTDLLFEEVKNE